MMVILAKDVEDLTSLEHDQKNKVEEHYWASGYEIASSEP
jgi:hypothetical protein